jgi:hypothetical protein
MWNRCEFVDVEECIRVLWIWDLCGDPTKGRIVVDATSPHLEKDSGHIDIAMEKSYIPSPFRQSE